MGSSEQTTKKAADTLLFCDGAKPIYWSEKDTVKTVVQVKSHNKVGTICGWGKK